MLYSFTLLLIFAALSNLAVNYSHSGRGVGKAIEAYEQVLQIENEDPGTSLLSLSTCEYET